MLNFFKNIVVISLSLLASTSTDVSAGVWGVNKNCVVDASTGTVQYLVNADMDAAATGTVQYLVNADANNADAATGTVQYKTQNMLSRCDG